MAQLPKLFYRTMLKARPHGSKINDEMADEPRMTRIVDFG